MIDGETPLAFEALGEQSGLEVVDRLEQQRYRIHTPEAVSPEPISTDEFHFPVGRAVSFETSELVLPTVVSVFVRDSDGELITEVEHLDAVSLPQGSYIVELSPQIKTYIEVRSSLEITADLTEIHFNFHSPSRVRLGARSRHERPAATVTTTESPVDVMAAIETFGSALKTTDPERSYPTLRGHPPAITFGDSLDIPDGIDVPDTGVRLELPPRLDVIYSASPLAYYLGADVVPGPAPRLVTDSGFEYSFDTPQGVENELVQTLKQVFFFDCITRTEGLYTVDLHEREAIEPYVGFDFADLYDRPIAEQVAAYLEVPFELVKDHLPQWRLTAHVEPEPENLEQLPFVIDDLAVIRTTRPDRSNGGTPRAVAEQVGEDTLTRSASSSTPSDSVSRRSAGGSSAREDIPYVQPLAEDSLEQAWIGHGIPIGASKLTTEAFQNRLDREVTDGDIEIDIVLNDSRMNEERDLVDDAYGDREDLPFDVELHQDVSVEELREIIERKSSFFHYIGHTEHDGFECVDGKLDVATVDSTDIEAFLLNACNSYRQGLRLIESGAIGGIVTLNDIINDGAIRIGETIARLLNAGFPLRAALTIARDQSVQGGQYIVVGDGGMTIGQPVGAAPNILDVSQKDGCFEVTMKTFATDEFGLGALLKPMFSNVTKHYLNSGKIDTFLISEEELAEFLNLTMFPVRLDDELYWSNSLSL